MSIETVTLGCRLNFAESETIRRLASNDEDWVVVNSCAVTNEAVRQTRQAIRHSRRQRPDARILVTGCAAELDPAGFKSMPEVDHVIRNDQDLRENLNYIAMNPVKAGYDSCAQFYPYTGFLD